MEEIARASSVTVESPVLPRWARRIIFLALLGINFFGFASYSIIAPFFPTEAQRKGVSQTVTGLVFSSFMLTDLIFAPTFGHYMSGTGPKWFLVIGGTVCGVANVVFGFLTDINDTLYFTVSCFLIRIIEALGFAAFETATFASVGRLFPETIGSAMGVVQIAIGIGMGIGPAIGSVLYSVGGYPLPFAVLGGIVICMACIVHLLITCIPGANGNLFQRVKSTENGITVWKFVQIGTSQLTLLIVVGCSCGWTCNISILALHLREQLGVDETGSGYFFSCQLISYGAMSLVAGLISDRCRPEYRLFIMVSGLVLTFMGLLLIGPSMFFDVIGIPVTPSAITNYVATALIGIGGALVIIPSFQVLMDSARDAGYYDSNATHSIVGGTMGGAYTLGAVAGPAIGAVLTEKYSFQLATSVIGAGQFVLAIAMAILLTTRVVSLRNRQRKNLAYNSLDEEVTARSSEKSPLLEITFAATSKYKE